jgi:hypothetical protein
MESGDLLYAHEYEKWIKRDSVEGADSHGVVDVVMTSCHHANPGGEPARDPAEITLVHRVRLYWISGHPA